jgi:hypothetical protein
LWTRFDKGGSDVGLACYEEWDQSRTRAIGKLLCSMAGSERVAVTREVKDGAAAAETPQSDAALRYRLDLPPDDRRTLLVALNLHRYGPEQVETVNQIVLYPKQTDAQAIDYSARAAVGALDANWPDLVRASYRWYERLPAFRLPNASWAADLYCALELPRGNTWSAQELIRQPWYTFCRVHGHDPYGWWSYGMHGHEHLSTFVVNVTEPTLSQSFLRGHFQAQKPDGYVQYGVNHRMANVHEGLATCPLLAWESWTTYLWSGDRTFLEQAYGACSRYVRWWRSPARTRAGQQL